ncbi:hypothetical protein AB4Z46_16560 [Variovorax sp. M-6]|uniref:hypothetical protein n=1 Tax=Variovorax sp. M-6 TaxID=3233041 RepID=UPI003F993719
MSINTTRTSAHANLGSAWLRDQSARLHQRHLQFRRHSAEVVVPDVQGEPSSPAIEKAVSIVQSRAYLENRALQLLVPLARDDGSWRLVTLDFGLEAQRHACEFLMCFAFQPVNGGLSITSPFVEIGFSLPVPTGDDRVFVLTVRTAAGFSS